MARAYCCPRQISSASRSRLLKCRPDGQGHAHQHSHHAEADEQRGHRVARLAAPRTPGYLDLTPCRYYTYGFHLCHVPPRLPPWLSPLSSPPPATKCRLLAPTESTVTLSINTTTLPINGTAELLATVIEPAGTPVHNGTLVTLYVLGRRGRASRRANGGGIARATFRAGTQSGHSGHQRVFGICSRGAGRGARRVARRPTAVSVRAEPATVPSTGGTVQVIAVVIGRQRQPLARRSGRFFRRQRHHYVHLYRHRRQRRGTNQPDHHAGTIVTARVAAMRGDGHRARYQPTGRDHHDERESRSSARR